jgi:hypothetical protein
MPYPIGRYQFEGPYTSAEALKDQSGVYVVVSTNGVKTNVIDVGESATVKTRVANHDRQACWRLHSIGDLRVAVLYTPHLQSAGRSAIEQELRRQYRPPCGDR